MQHIESADRRLIIPADYRHRRYGQHFTRKLKRPGDSSGIASLIWIFAYMAIGLTGFIVSYYLLIEYWSGDPAHYRKYYDVISGGTLADAIYLQSRYLGSSELIYPVVALAGTKMRLDHDIYMAAFDGVLLALLAIALRRLKSSFAFAFLTFTNFYLLVLLLSAERLKFAYFLMLLAFLTSSRIKFFFLAFAPLAHLQAIIMEASVLGYSVFSISKLWTRMALIVGGTALLLVVTVHSMSAIQDKVGAYQGSGGVSQLIQGVIIASVAFACFRKRLSLAIAFAPLMALTFVLGGSRMNMITITVFWFIALVQEKTRNIMILCLMAAFSLKSVGFVHNVLAYGDAFYVNPFTIN